MEPEYSSHRREASPEKEVSPAKTEDQFQERVSGSGVMAMESELVRLDQSKILDLIQEKALSILESSFELEETYEKLTLMEERGKELERAVKEFELNQKLDIERRSKEAELLEKSLKKLEEREKELSLLDENVKEKLIEVEKKDEIFEAKQKEKAEEIEVKSKILVLKEKDLEELKSELETKKNEISLLDENITAKSSELEKKEEIFKLTQEAEVREIEEKIKLLVSKEKDLEELKSQLEASKNEISLLSETIKEKQEAEDKEIEEKSKMLVLKEKELEEREKKLVMKQRELEEEESSTQAETHKRSRLQFEPSLLEENTDSLILPGRKHKPIRESSIETDLALVLHRGTSSDPASSEHSSEVKEIDCTDLELEPFTCPDPDFNEFSNTMSSLAVGQVWALYDPLDGMPRYYAQIKRVFKAKLSVRVKWLESLQASDNEKDVPIACGRFKYQDSETQSLSMFSHKMLHITCGKHVIINPRKGETWALFRDWTKTWNSHKPPFRYDFVEVISEFDKDHGIGVAYLGKVERFTSVYKAAEQHGLIQAMIATDEMLKFSHRVPSFKLTGDEKEEVPVGSFELDPAAIP